MIGVPLVIGVFILQQEALSLISNLIYRIKVGYLDVPDSIKDMPIIGQQVKDVLWRINKKPRRDVRGVSYLGTITFILWQSSI